MRNFTRHSSSRRQREEDCRYLLDAPLPAVNCIFTMEPRAIQGTRGNRLSVAMLCSFYRRALHRSIKRGLPGCAYINNNCRANNKPEGSALDSPKLLVPLPRAARFYCLFSSVRNGGSPLHRPRWRINDPAIRRRAAPRMRLSSPPHCPYPRLRCLRIRTTHVPSGVPRHLSYGIVRELVKSLQKRTPHAR